MPARAWRNTRDLAAVMALLAVLQLVVSVVAVGTLSPWMLAGELALIALLLGLAVFAHLRRNHWLRRGYGANRW